MSNRYLLEIGVEELPARFINGALKQLKENCEKMLAEERIGFGQITTYATPRRLTMIIDDLSQGQDTIEEMVKGPAKGLHTMRKAIQLKPWKDLCEAKELDWRT